MSWWELVILAAVFVAYMTVERWVRSHIALYRAVESFIGAYMSDGRLDAWQSRSEIWAARGDYVRLIEGGVRYPLVGGWHFPEGDIGPSLYSIPRALDRILAGYGCERRESAPEYPPGIVPQVEYRLMRSPNRSSSRPDTLSGQGT